MAWRRSAAIFSSGPAGGRFALADEPVPVPAAATAGAGANELVIASATGKVGTVKVGGHGSAVGVWPTDSHASAALAWRSKEWGYWIGRGCTGRELVRRAVWLHGVAHNGSDEGGARRVQTGVTIKVVTIRWNLLERPSTDCFAFFQTRRLSTRCGLDHGTHVIGCWMRRAYARSAKLPTFARCPPLAKPAAAGVVRRTAGPSLLGLRSVRTFALPPARPLRSFLEQRSSCTGPGRAVWRTLLHCAGEGALVFAPALGQVCRPLPQLFGVCPCSCSRKDSSNLGLVSQSRPSSATTGSNRAVPKLPGR